MRKVDKYSYLPIKRKIDNYLSCKDSFATPDPEFFEEQIKNPDQTLKRKRRIRLKKVL